MKHSNNFAARFITAFALIAAGALAAAPSIAGESLDRVKERGVLTVATESDWFPQAFINDDNELDGFDVDVAKEIARRMEVDIRFVTPEWDIIIAGNWGGRWDLSVGSMTPTKERGEVLDFPAIYYYAPAGFAVHEDSGAQTKADLNGKRIAACSGCTFEYYLQKDLTIDAEGVPPFTYDVTPGEIVSLRDPSTIFNDLRLGDGVRLDAMIDSLPTIRAAIANGYPLRVVGTPAFYEPLALAIDKGDAEFNAVLGEVIRLMHQDGTLSRLSNKWYEVDYTSSTN